MPTPLSVIIITRNAANLLPRSLASVKWASEIILLDSGSNDNTVEIALSSGVKVFIYSDWMGYGIQRQRAQQFATEDYVLMIDADEQVTSRLRQSIQSVISIPKPGIIYSIARRNYFLGKFMRYSGWYPDRVTRLYERKRYQYNRAKVHESLDCKDARIVALRGDLLHFTCCNFSKFQHKQLCYATTWATERYQCGKKISLTGVFIHSIGAFFKTLLLRGGVLDGKHGWLLACVHAYYTFNKYATLWSLNYTHIKNIDNNQ